MYGYMGKLLRVDLTRNEIREEELKEELAKKFIGGSGLSAKIIYDELPNPAEVDPLSPENILIFMTGPLVGVRVPNSGRHSVCAKSPLTGIWGEANSGGTWGVEFKKTGYDGIIITGKAEKPVYLWIHEGGVEIRDASHLWGKDTFETDEILKEETDKKAVTASIGPSGEKLVKIAAVMNDGKDARAAGRTGMGAVMGSKNLKAIAVRGDKEIPVYDEERLKELTKDLGKMIAEKAERMGKYGTANIVIMVEEIGDLPIKNWLQGRWVDGAEKLSGERMAETILKRRYFCKNCVIGCGRIVEIQEGKWKLEEQAGPEYETIGAFGSMCLVDDLGAVSKLNEICNRYGIDTISAGSIVAFAMEAYEKGILKESDIGFPLKWGDADAAVRLTEMIAKKEGIGALLSEGVRRAAEKLGGLALEMAIHSKGLELPMHDPRAYSSIAVAYATSNRGACHLQGLTHPLEGRLVIPELGYSEPLDRFEVKGKGIMSAKMQNLMAMFDSLTLCKFLIFGGITVRHLVDWLNATTGWNFTVEEFLKTGERIYNIKRMFNVKCGVSRKDDTMPLRVLTHKRGEGGSAEHLPAWNIMLSEYYEFRGWDEMGIPKEEKLRELGLEW
ncbi:MAG: aldehyde ferredoxin oxidoreductase family protein [Archaeoglobi archaeon]|nr:aldehyde ferredoxin oxidoreductase family protein [Candidatus Mnemosynella sp.]